MYGFLKTLDNQWSTVSGALTSPASFARVSLRSRGNRLLKKPERELGGRQVLAANAGRRLLMGIALLAPGLGACLIKQTIRVPVSPAVREAKTASPSDLVAQHARYESGVRSLSSASLKITYTAGRRESGKLQQYRSTPGYALLCRPDTIRMNIQNPVTKTTLADMVSIGEDFSVWYPHENKLFKGKNSVRDYELEDGTAFSLRPRHIFEAIMPAGLTPLAPGDQLAFEEADEPTAKYYILSVLRTGSDGILRPVRREWIERSNLAPARIVTYDGTGKPAGIATYGGYQRLADFFVPLQVRLERPEEGYTLDLVFRDWRLNPELPDDAFALKPPPGSRVVELQEKARSEAP